MRSKKALNKITTLLNNISFTSKEAQTYGVSAATLSHYVKCGELIRIGHGIYRKAGRDLVDDFRWEDLVEAEQKTKGTICLISALSLYEMTEEIPRQHWIAISHKTSRQSSANIKIVRFRNAELGKTTFKIGDVVLPIYDRERTIIDSFKYLSIETAIKALRLGLKKRGEEKLNIQKLQQYAKVLHFKIEPYLITETT